MPSSHKNNIYQMNPHVRGRIYADHHNLPLLPKYKYSFNRKTHDLNSPLDNKSMFSKMGRQGISPPNIQTTSDKMKSGSSFSLEKINSSILDTYEPQSATKNPKPRLSKDSHNFKLPLLKKWESNPQNNKNFTAPEVFYQARVYKALKNSKESTYLANLARQHFIQSIQALKIGKDIKPNAAQKDIKLSKKYPKFKTIYLDMDETLIHCDQNSNNYTVKLKFPIDGGGFIAAGIRIRPHCQAFLKELCSFCEVIIFTASSASYADVVLDHLDPGKKFFAHRLYRQHCTLQKGFFVKDLRVVNRRLEDCLLVDNSAFSFMFQPENGIPILPFYHLAKDKELLPLIDFLRKAVKYEDMRDLIKQTFFWDQYLEDSTDPRKIFTGHFDNEKKG